MGILDIFRKITKPGWRFSLRPEDKKRAQEKWQYIQEMMKAGHLSQFKQAVIESDKLLNFILERMNYPGPSLGDRIRASRNRYSDYSGLWYAHKVRNTLVHNVDLEVYSWQAQKAIKIFEKAFKDLGVI